MSTPRDLDSLLGPDPVPAPPTVGSIPPAVTTPPRRDRTTPPPVVPPPQPLTVLSQQDAYVAERLKTRPAWQDDPSVDVLPKEGFNAMALPEELTRYLDRFAFYWIFKSKRAIDRALDVRGWALVNRESFADLPAHCFTVQGSVERGDCVLGFMPQARARQLREEPGEKSRQQLEHVRTRHLGRDNFYVPAQLQDEDGDTSPVVPL